MLLFTLQYITASSTPETFKIKAEKIIFIIVKARSLSLRQELAVP
jgi:hypothetical protein